MLSPRILYPILRKSKHVLALNTCQGRQNDAEILVKDFFLYKRILNVRFKIFMDFKGIIDKNEFPLLNFP